ncbi:RloB domain-containing protein [Clostridium perfringens]
MRGCCKLRVRKILGEASDNRVREAKKKFIFGYEGAKTEKEYFTGIAQNKEYFGISDLVEVINLERFDKTQSNQLNVVKEIDKFISLVKVCEEECGSFGEKVEILLSTYEINLDEETKGNLKNYLENYNYDLDDKLFFDELKNILKNETTIDRIKGIKDLENIDFEYDEINIIIDRDYKSFTEEQFQEVVNICNENNYNLGLTNPCFEFWLLLHLTDCSEYDNNKIKENKKEKTKRNFLEKCLIDKLNRYRKDKINFENYREKVKIAIKNIENYCQDIEQLNDNIGSSLGIIIKKLIKI